MERLRNGLMQVGTLILCINGAVWLKDSLANGAAPGPAVVLFRLGVCLLGLLLMATAGILTVVILLNRRNTVTPFTAVSPVADDEFFE